MGDILSKQYDSGSTIVDEVEERKDRMNAISNIVSTIKPPISNKILKKLLKKIEELANF
jgi:hypothetical protein